jgi:membrane protein YdbS with pleckstrin-like domain
LRAVSTIARVFSPGDEGGKPVLTGPNERVCVDARRHGVVLARPLVRALAPAAAGAVLTVQPWPLAIVGAALLAFGAALALRAVWRWDRTRVVLTNEKLYVVHGIVRRHTAGVRLRAVDAVELEQSLTGRLLGYGTLTVGALEVTHVPQVRRVAHLVERLST